MDVADSTSLGKSFIVLWSEMGTHWGVPKTMAQLHALLFIDGGSLNTDQLMQRLEISRGNASMTLRILVEWGVITRMHCAKDRKDYYQAEQDVWKLFATIARARKHLEIEPLLGRLQNLLEQPQPSEDVASDAQRTKIERMLGLVRNFDALAEKFLSMDSDALQMLGHLMPSK